MVSAMGGYVHVVAVWLTIPLPSYPLLSLSGSRANPSKALPASTHPPNPHTTYLQWRHSPLYKIPYRCALHLCNHFLN